MATAAVQLGRGRPDEARRDSDEGIKPFPSGSFYLQHAYSAFLQTQVDLYEGDGGGCVREDETLWPSLRQTVCSTSRPLRTWARYLRAAAPSGGARG